MTTQTELESPPSEMVVTRKRSRRSDIVFTFALALGLYLVWVTREVLLVVYVSALFAVVFVPVLRGIEKIKIGRWSPSRGIAILILFLAAALFFALFFFFAVPPIVSDMREFLKELPTRGPQLLQKAQRFPLLQHIDTTSLNAKLQDFASNSATYLLVALGAGAGKLADIATGVILAVYFVLEGEEAYNWLLSFFPWSARTRLDKTLTIAEARMGKWLLGQGSLMLILGVTSTIVFLLLHVRYAYALGVIMGLFNIIPIAGALISMVLVILVAAIDSWGRVIGVHGLLRNLCAGRNVFSHPHHHEVERRPGWPLRDDRAADRLGDRRCGGRDGLCADGGAGGRAAQRVLRAVRPEADAQRPAGPRQRDGGGQTVTDFCAPRLIRPKRSANRGGGAWYDDHVAAASISASHRPASDRICCA